MGSVSILTSRVTKDLVVPGTDVSVVIRRLSPKQLQAAALARSREQLTTIDALFGADRVRELQKDARTEKTDGPKPDDAASEPKPLLQFDHATLMQKAIVRWSLDAEITLETCEDVDADTAEWLAREILMLAKPSLFGSAVQEAEQKNG